MGVKWTPDNDQLVSSVLPLAGIDVLTDDQAPPQDPGNA